MDLFEAAKKGQLAAITAVVAQGAAVDSSDEHGNTPLTLAAIYGHNEVVSWFLAAGADPNWRDSAGITILMKAAELPSATVVRTLIAAGADPNARTDDGQTALLSAVWSADSTPDVVQALIDGGADVTVADREYGLKPREWAEETRKTRVAALLEEAER